MRSLAGIVGCLCLALAATHSNRIRFEDATANSGIRFVLDNHPTANKQLPETMAGGIAAFDYNNDGKIDLFFTGASGPSALYRNDGNLHFTDVTTELGLGPTGFMTGVAVGDFDNDGYADLFIAGVHECHLYRNIGGRRFEDVSKIAGIVCPEWSVAAAWLDYDGDGLLDLFVVNYLDWRIDNSPVCRDSSGGIVVYCNPRQLRGTPNRLYRNLGGGRFQDVSVSTGIGRSIGKGMSAAVADYDGDGWPDLYVTNDTEPNFLFHNLGGKRFEEVALEAGVSLPDDGKPVSSMGVDFRDYNNDGLPDIVYTALTRETFPIFRNAGKGRFEDVTSLSHVGRLTSPFSGWSVALVDLDNDGWKDLFTANAHVTDNIGLFSADRYKLSNTILPSHGDGTFENAIEMRPPRAHRGAVVTDLDGDGRPDIVVSVLGERPEVWRNVTMNENHWMGLKLMGGTSNRDGVGAVIRVGSQWNQQTSSVGYASSVLAPVHFGLGSLTSVPSVEIKWPSGAKQTLRDLKADQMIEVREPQ